MRPTTNSSHVYWNGLHQWLKDISGYKYDQLTDFDELRKEVRLMEQEHSGKKTQSNMAVSTGGATGQSSDIQGAEGYDSAADYQGEPA